jgi:hypothetical protein
MIEVVDMPLMITENGEGQARNQSGTVIGSDKPEVTD